ncbi:MAG: PadR family transcriptional regulator [Candidatus Kerfeldbacteria bacterium]|nr:PadR family transcriptional regulator [Candidatus Kerfeldbacteria bacterium]
MNRQSLKGHSELLILAALAVRPMHGYALSEYLKGQLPEFKFGMGMIYPLLHKLEQKKYIKGEWKQVLGADRRVYSLTKQGKKALQSKRREWRAFSSLITKAVAQSS